MCNTTTPIDTDKMNFRVKETKSSSGKTGAEPLYLMSDFLGAIINLQAPVTFSGENWTFELASSGVANFVFLPKGAYQFQAAAHPYHFVFIHLNADQTERWKEHYPLLEKMCDQISKRIPSEFHEKNVQIPKALLDDMIDGENFKSKDKAKRQAQILIIYQQVLEGEI